MAISKIDFFHDAILKEMNIIWENGSALITFHLNEAYAKEDNLMVISIANIIDFHLPRLLPWGESIYVNEVSYNESEKKIEIEMQSGDVIEILAKDFYFSHSNIY